jgi:hypothetical protein
MLNFNVSAFSVDFNCLFEAQSRAMKVVHSFLLFALVGAIASAASLHVFHHDFADFEIESEDCQFCSAQDTQIETVYNVSDFPLADTHNFLTSESYFFRFFSFFSARAPPLQIFF